MTVGGTIRFELLVPWRALVVSSTSAAWAFHAYARVMHENIEISHRCRPFYLYQNVAQRVGPKITKAEEHISLP